MENENIIRINGVEPPLHLKSEPGRYSGLIVKVQSVILNELNTGKKLEVTMLNKMEAEELLKHLVYLKVNDDNAYILEVENNFLNVEKRVTFKTGI